MNLLNGASVILSLSVTLIGFPLQIRKNFINKDTSELSLPLYFFTLLSYAVWTLRGYCLNDWCIVWTSGPGTVLALVIFCQIYYYRKPR